MDPVFTYVVCGLLALVFLAAAAHKLRAPREFAGTVRAYELVPARAAAAVAALLVFAELCVGIGLVLPATRRTALILAILVLALYGAGIAINLLRGRREIDCGCGGPATRQPLSGWLLLRNAALAAAAAAALLPHAPRALGAFDLYTIAVAVGVLFLLYTTSGHLLAQRAGARASA